MRSLKSYHMEHHYKEPNLGFGVTSRIWDWVFGAFRLDRLWRELAADISSFTDTEFVSQKNKKAAA